MGHSIQHSDYSSEGLRFLIDFLRNIYFLKNEWLQEKQKIGYSLEKAYKALSRMSSTNRHHHFSKKKNCICLVFILIYYKKLHITLQNKYIGLPTVNTTLSEVKSTSFEAETKSWYGAYV